MIVSKDRVEKALSDLSDQLSEDWEGGGAIWALNSEETKYKEIVEGLARLHEENKLSANDILEIDRLVKRNFHSSDSRKLFLSQNEISSLEDAIKL